MFSEDLLKDKRILITDGGTGLGKEIATRYLSLGAEVWIAGRRGPTLETTANELMAAHDGTVRTHALDIRDAQAVDAMVERIWTEAVPLTGLVNNAAGNFISSGYLANGGSFTEMDQLSDADWDRMPTLIKTRNEKDRSGRTA